jgi:hypothetical protein
MPATHKQWIVLPHGKLQELEPGILTATGYLHMPFTRLPRRMTVARLAGGRLVIFSAIALDDACMRKLESYGQPAFLVVPSDKHRLDAKIWKDRYPAMVVVAPEGSRKNIEDVVEVGTSAPRFDDPNVEFVTVPGTAEKEAALLIHTPDGATLVVNDLIGNIRNSTGLGGWFLRLMHFAGDEPQIPRPVRWTMVKDVVALRDQLLQWANVPALRRVLVAHGDAIDFQPAEALRDLAHSLTYDSRQHGRAQTS